jgi:hypothetical protein
MHAHDNVISVYCRSWVGQIGTLRLSSSTSVSIPSAWILHETLNRQLHWNFLKIKRTIVAIVMLQDMLARAWGCSHDDIISSHP